MRENAGTSDAICQLQSRKGRFDEIGPWKNHGDEMLCRTIRSTGNGICSQNHGLVIFIILQHGVRDFGETISIVNIPIHVDRYHLGPFLEIFLFFRSELVLIFFRPTMEVTGFSENKRRTGLRVRGPFLFGKERTHEQNWKKKSEEMYFQ